MDISIISSRIHDEEDYQAIYCRASLHVVAHNTYYSIRGNAIPQCDDSNFSVFPTGRWEPSNSGRRGRPLLLNFIIDNILLFCNPPAGCREEEQLPA